MVRAEGTLIKEQTQGQACFSFCFLIPQMALLKQHCLQLGYCAVGAGQEGLLTGRTSCWGCWRGQ